MEKKKKKKQKKTRYALQKFKNQAGFFFELRK